MINSIIYLLARFSPSIVGIMSRAMELVMSKMCNILVKKP
jgi:hypothetical protein